MEKILFVASLPSHIKAFHIPYLKWLKEQGYETHVACNGGENIPYVDALWDVPFQRSPFSLKNRKAFVTLKNIINSEKFVLINCHTPMASFITRLTSIKARKEYKTKLLYTAHGFHFYKGAPIINWLLYFPIEVILSKYTDAIICINKEDYNIISQKGSNSCKYYLVPGIGVNSTRFFKVSKIKKSELRYKNGFKDKDFILIYAAEFIQRKNHEFIINAIAKNKEKFEGVKILFAGRGPLQERLQKKVVKLNLSSLIIFIGYRKDIDLIYKMSDVVLSSSKQEGLPINIVEGMMCGLPVIATIERGHNELVVQNENGFLFSQNNSEEFSRHILNIKDNGILQKKLSLGSLQRAALFEINNSLLEISDIFKLYL